MIDDKTRDREVRLAQARSHMSVVALNLTKRLPRLTRPTCSPQHPCPLSASRSHLPSAF